MFCTIECTELVQAEISHAVATSDAGSATLGEGPRLVDARCSLGARSVPSTSFNSSVFPSQSPSPSPAPTPQAPSSSLRSFAPLQPQPRNQSQSTPTTPAGTTTTPNYNFSSLSISSSGLPPLQPTSSSIFPASSSVPPHQQPPQQQAQSIKWNVVPPLQPTTPSHALPLSASQPPSARPTNFPPGYSSSSVTLQPTIRNPGGVNGSAGGAGWGDWKDLDPLK